MGRQKGSKNKPKLMKSLPYVTRGYGGTTQKIMNGVRKGVKTLIDYGPAAYGAYQILKDKYNQPVSSPVTKTITKSKKKSKTKTSTGGANQYQGTIGTGKKKSYTDIFAKVGSVTKMERGGNVSSSDLNHSVYLGYGTPGKILYRNILRAIIHKLVNKAGFHIRDWKRPAVYDLYSAASLPNKDMRLRLRLQWRYSGVTTAPTISIFDYRLMDAAGTADTNNTWYAISNALDTSIATAIADGVATTTGNSLSFDNLAFSIYNFTEDHEIPLSNINLNESYMDFQVKTSVAVTNVTKAASTDGDEYSADNILANPLEGKLYTIKKWTNSFIQKQQAYSDASGVTLQPTDLEPIFSTTSNVTNTNALQKPPSYYFWNNCKYSEKVILDPGKVKKFGTSFESSMTFGTFLNKYHGLVAYDETQLGKYEMDFGNAQLIGLESMLNNRSETGAVVSIDYEMNQRIAVMLREKRQAALPILDIA